MDNDKQKVDNMVGKKSREISILKANESLSFIQKKAQKISCAIYLITNHLSDREPLKWEARKASLGFIKDTILLVNNFSDNLWVSEKFEWRITAIISFLDLLDDAGFISKMNHSILKTEITNLASFLEVKSNITNYTGSKLEDNFFDVPKPSQDYQKETLRLIADLRNKTFLPKNDPASFIKDISKGQTDKGHLSLIKNQNVFSPKNKIAGSGSERKQKIISYIRLKKEVGIKDISSVIKGCSEKTLQRDLVSLVQAGVLKKKGERRWSSYFLA